MSNEKDDGGQAFPSMETAEYYVNPGMSRREWLAGLAMRGMVAGALGKLPVSDDISAYANGHCNAVIVDRSYALADLMIAEGNKEQK